MKRENGIAVYFWTLVIGALLLGYQDRSIESAVLIAGAGIVGVRSLIGALRMFKMTAPSNA